MKKNHYIQSQLRYIMPKGILNSCLHRMDPMPGPITIDHGKDSSCLCCILVMDVEAVRYREADSTRLCVVNGGGGAVVAVVVVMVCGVSPLRGEALPSQCLDEGGRTTYAWV